MSFENTEHSVYSNNREFMTLEEVSFEMHLTRERVRQIQTKALGKVFKKMCALHPTLDNFDVMAAILVGFKISGQHTNVFYSSFPNNVKRKVERDAHNHAPYIEKNEKLRSFRKTIDNVQEAC